MPTLKFTRIETAPDNNGRVHNIKTNGGTLHSLYMGKSGDEALGTSVEGGFQVTLYDNSTSATGAIIANMTLSSNSFLPLNVDFSNGLTAFVRSGAGGALTVVYD